MKAVMLSIQPKWCELIASGKKTVEVRKTQPKLQTPFKVYIYCTQEKRMLTYFRPGEEWYGQKAEKFTPIHRASPWSGKVIGEFVCDEIIVAKCGQYCNIPLDAAFLDAFCLMDYADGKTVYGWHISDLVIYDEPKPLSKYMRCPYPWDCGACDLFDGLDMSCNRKIRPPQSWCYVEELNDGQ